MINKFVSVLTLLLITFSAQANHPKEDIEKWLARMHHAAHMINYEGNFVYGQNNDLTSMQIIHGVDKTGEYERLISLDGSGREVIRSGDTVTCVLPDKKSVVVDKSRPTAEFPPMFPLKIEQLLKTYRFHFGDDAIVAGQKAKKLLIKPKDQYRYGHALWVDSNTGLLLKDHLLDSNQNIVEQFMFTKISYLPEIDKSRLQSKNNTKKYTWYKSKDVKEKIKSNESMNWKVTNVPPGFTAGLKRHQTMAVSAMPVEHFIYSDGLSSVSVFVEKKMKSSKNLTGSSSMGAVNAYGRDVGDYHVTVVGEVPYATVKMIADSVEYLKH